jgi:hypothetical protein
MPGVMAIILESGATQPVLVVATQVPVKLLSAKPYRFCVSDPPIFAILIVALRLKATTS